MAKNKTNPKVMVLAALVGNGLIMVTKFIVAALSGSVAMMAEAVHSVADTFNQVFLLISLKFGSRPADEAHPFGYGKERFFWAFLTAVIIFFVGAFFSVYEGVKKLLELAHAPDDTHFVISMVTLGIAFVFETGSITVAAFEVRHAMKDTKRGFADFITNTKDLTIKTVLFEDTAALIGLVIAAAGLLLARITGNQMYDGLASIFIGLVLAAVAFYLAKESRALLIGQAATKEELTAIRKCINSSPGVEEIIDLLSMHLSPEEILLNAHLQLSAKLSSKQQEELIDKIENGIRLACPKVKRIYIEPERSAHKEADIDKSPSLTKRG